MRPITSYVLKIHGRCNLSCDHCYVYESVDQSWRPKPQAMSLATARAAAMRIDEHAHAHSLNSVQIILHGGEPLLVGLNAMDSLLTLLRRTISSPSTFDLHVQTNGVLLDVEMCELLVRHRVRIGISLDGPRAANDRHRRFANGASSYDQVTAALRLLREPRFASAYPSAARKSATSRTTVGVTSTGR